jgi:hypothetical protein
MTTIRRRTQMHDAEGRSSPVSSTTRCRCRTDQARRRVPRARGRDRRGDDARPPRRPRRAPPPGGRRLPDQTAKYIRALAPATPLTPEIAVADLGPDANAGDVVGRAIALSVIRLIRHDSVVRLDVDPEGVHQARVATRRLRSDLRTFGPLVDEDWASALRTSSAGSRRSSATSATATCCSHD